MIGEAYNSLLKFKDGISWGGLAVELRRRCGTPPEPGQLAEGPLL